MLIIIKILVINNLKVWIKILAMKTLINKYKIKLSIRS